MRGFKAFAFVTVASVLLAGSLQAQWIGEAKWAGVNEARSSGRYSHLADGGGQTWNVYTSPYRAQFKISNPSTPPLMPYAGFGSTWGPVVDIFCVDLLHYANTSTSGYNAYFTNLSTFGDLGVKTRLGGVTGLAKYLAAAYLSQKIRQVGVNTADAKDMNGAIWQIMSGDPYYRYTGGTPLWDNAGINYWKGQAESNALYVNPGDWVVVTQRNADGTIGASQEYLTQVTPEPATMLLLGTGLVVMLMAAGALRRPTV